MFRALLQQTPIVEIQPRPCSCAPNPNAPDAETADAEVTHDSASGAGEQAGAVGNPRRAADESRERDQRLGQSQRSFTGMRQNWVAHPIDNTNAWGTPSPEGDY